MNVSNLVLFFLLYSTGEGGIIRIVPLQRTDITFLVGSLAQDLL